MNYANLSLPFTMQVFRRGCLVSEGLLDPLLDRIPANNWGRRRRSLC
ncbi:MAG: hypothetical protein ACRDRP_14510 [Pseudonocardiaceae bacterium]